MKVHVLEPIHAAPLARLRQNAEVVDWKSPSVLELESADAVIVRAAKVDRAMMEKAPKLRVIGKHGVGLDAIDVSAARELGKEVVYTPEANQEAVAELAVAFMMALSRKIAFGHSQLRAGAYSAVCPPELTGSELLGKTVGLVGLGRIGRRVSEILQNGFSMQAIGFDPFLSEEKFGYLGIEKAPHIEELFRRSDYISISVPLLPQTEMLVNTERLSLCKENCILVNTARGGIVDETALYEALKSGTLKAAASDVFKDEPLSSHSPLLSLDNFIAMPHIGASTEESLIRMGEAVVDDVLRVLSGASPINPAPIC